MSQSSGAPGSGGGSGSPRDAMMQNPDFQKLSPSQQNEWLTRFQSDAASHGINPIGGGGYNSTDYTGLAEQQHQSSVDATNTQTQQNRPDQVNAFGSSTTWSIGPDGKPVQTQSFGGPLGGAAQSLQQQAASALSNPFDLGALGKMGTGDSARDQAINAAYGQATSRLDPMFGQRETQLRSRLANQGLDMNSEAYKNAMGDFGRERNDAYGSAMNSAIGQGTAAGSAVFNQNMMARQQQLAEMLRQRGQAMGDLQGMSGLLGQPGFNAAGRAETTQYLPAGLAQDQYLMNLQNMNNENTSDAINGGFDLLKSFIPGTK